MSQEPETEEETEEEKKEDSSLVETEFRPPETLEAAFLRFHGENPQVYAELVKLCRQARRQGHTKIGMKMLWEVMRWNLWLAVKTDDDFKLNNNHTSRYARLIMRTEPDLASIFDLRVLKRD